MANGHRAHQRPPTRGGRAGSPEGPRGRGDVIPFELPRRAAPGYVAAVLCERHTLQSSEDWKGVPPGHRFQLYFHGLADSGTVEAPQGLENKREREARRKAAEIGDWETLRTKSPNIDHEWLPLRNQRRIALQAAAGMGKVAIKMLAELAKRADALQRPDDWHRDAELIAPLATGLGNPHPVENGFAFLSPYGVPYLAGSGVKGVLRRAAEELALFDSTSAWTLAHVWALFGFDEKSAYIRDDDGAGNWRHAYSIWMAQVRERRDPVLDAWLEAIRAQFPPATRGLEQAEFLAELAKSQSLRRTIHWQGLLAMQDAFPHPEAKMAVDILNPHHKSYYEGKGTPHDAENPVPIFFLTIAPGARFTFRVRPLHGREALWQAMGDWKTLVDAAFDHARDWLGFGAKTAVGYGAMVEISPEQAAAARAGAEQARLRCEWVDATVRELAAKNNAKESDTLRGKALAEAWAALTDPELKASALTDIRGRWQAEGWWDTPPGGAAKKARAIYAVIDAER